MELLCIEVIPKHAKPFFVVCWYRPPDSKVDKFQDLENVISYLETFQKEIIFLGDTDCNLLECDAVFTTLLGLNYSLMSQLGLHLIPEH